MPLTLEHINYIYGEGTPYEIKALDDVSLTIPDGQFAGIIGHTGSGKSTLIQLFNGLEKPTSGKVMYNGENIWEEGYDRRQLFENAMEDAWHNAPPTLRDMQASLFGSFSENLLESSSPVAPEDKAMMYVLSNSECQYGAAAMFYPGVQEKIAENLGEGYYALPSSLHEYLIVPESSGIDPREMAKMVSEANRTESVVQPKDVLSDNVLHYDREARHLDNLPFNRQQDARMEAR